MDRVRAIAVCLALAAFAAMPSGARAQSPYEGAIQYALEKLVSGIHTASGFGGTAVAVTPVRTWKSVTGHYCREYDITVTEPGGEPVRDRQTRCREEGYWRPVSGN